MTYSETPPRRASLHSTLASTIRIAGRTRRVVVAALARAKFWRRKLVFVGDSHLGPIAAAHRDGRLGARRCRFVSVGGATAAGIRREDSRTGALAKYRRALLPYDPRKLPVIQLGEVDCGIVIWRRAADQGEPPDPHLERSIAAYAGFLDELRGEGYRTVLVLSAMPPTIRDGDHRGTVSKLRQSVTASLHDRTALTHRFNQRLRDETEARGLTFVDLTPLLIDPATGLIQDRMRHSDPEENHLSAEIGGAVIADHLRRRLKVLTRSG